MTTRVLGAFAVAAAIAALGCSGKTKANCTPQCENRTCGDDGCGGSCGACASGAYCNVEFACVPSRCPKTQGAITVDTLCDTIQGSFGKYYLWQYRACGIEVQPGDIAHLDAMAPLGVSGVLSQIGSQSATMTCDAKLKEQYAALRASVIGERLCFDSAAADACAAGGRALAAEGRYGAPEPEVCGRIFMPALHAGDACLFSYECGDGTYCHMTDNGVDACRGTCVQPLAPGEVCTRFDTCGPDSYCTDYEGEGVTRCKALGREGEACDYINGQLYCATGFYCEVDEQQNTLCRATKGKDQPCASIAECADGLTCLPSGSAQTCQPKPAPGDVGTACGAATQVECDLDKCLYCEGATATQAGTCKAYPKAGDACHTVTLDNGSTAFACDRYAVLACDETTVLCQPKPREGEACVVTPQPGYPLSASSAGNCLYMDDYCKRAAADATTGVCARNPGVGERCQNRFDASANCTDGSSCLGASSTVSGTCKLPQQDGETCQFDEQCASGFCEPQGNSGTCTKGPGAGEPCDVPPGTNPTPRCNATAWCDTSGDAPVCVGLAASGAACTDDGQCASGLCDKDASRCVNACDKVQRSSCWDGLDWFSKYIFASGAVGLLALRRRGPRRKDDDGDGDEPAKA